MYLRLKNKYLAGLVLILASIGFNDLSAASKTWAKDESGRVLIYRAEPLKLELLFATGISACGIFVGYFTIKFFNLPLLLRNLRIISICALYSLSTTGLGIWNLNRWYHDYDSLYKPLIIIDKRGIIYEGKKKILWEKVSNYYSELDSRLPLRIVTKPSLLCLRIISDIDELIIHDYEIAITMEELEELVDEFHSEYKNSVKEKVTT